MKQTELSLQKRLVIVEPSENEEIVCLVTTGYAIKHDGKESYTVLDNKNELKLICKGSELTEEITSELVPQKMNVFIPQFWNYKDHEDLFHATKSFISAIEAQGYYWGENPEGDEPNKYNYVFEDHPELVGNPKEYNEMAYLIDLGEWQEAESKTFNPEKTLIFEILL